MTRRALIIVDIQNDYFPGGNWPVAGMEAAAANAARLLAKARETGDLVAHVHHEIEGDDAPFFKPGTPGAAINASVAPKAGEKTVLKHLPNSFARTGLEAFLRENGVEAVTICGAMSQMCIDATARAASDMGFDVTVVEDACGAKETAFGGIEVPPPQVHATIMGALDGTYAAVVTTDAYLAG